MLRYNFKRILKLRRIDKPFSYLVKQGYSDNFATRISNNRVERLSLDDLLKLCELFQCTPNDLMEWIPGEKDANNTNHPLISLKRDNKAINLQEMLNKVPLDKIAEIEDLIIKQLKE